MFRKLTRDSLEKFLSRHASSERVLDIGSGGSSYDRFFPNRLTVDIDPERKPEIVGDIHDLPFKDNEFNLVLCTEVLEHAIDPRKAISELHRVMREGGTLILTTRFVYPIHDSPHDYWRFTAYGLRELFKGWDIVELETEVATLSTIAVLLQRVAYQTKLWANTPSKLVLFMFAALLNRCNFLIREEYGDIKKSAHEPHLMTSGYYLVCKKK